MPSSPAPTRFCVLLYPGFEPLDVFGPVEVFQTLSRTHPIHLSFLSASSDPALDPVSTAPPPGAPTSNPRGSIAWTSVAPTHTLASPPSDTEVLLVPGGVGSRSPGSAPGACIDYITATYPRLRSLLSVCTGAELLARSGVLAGRRATGNKKHWGRITAADPAAKWEKKARWVRDGNIWTSGGVSAGTDMALGWVAAHFGEEVARAVANDIEYEWRNDPEWDVFAYVWS
ncbi:class I glutamine amidotransferase-like protein [Epithele typhae]|uniref:class I glutamine amidotransferase-like protein n=1 Tax=Epithele typhae TaxID=378194 RepID=UPI0020084942|nr:class I glutamine amidotransferase-like protein [Epithele typhae]KAH9926614.1 class I glutamine amidotransferase-like protein [Epithele typhae]